MKEYPISDDLGKRVLTDFPGTKLKEDTQMHIYDTFVPPLEQCIKKQP